MQVLASLPDLPLLKDKQEDFRSNVNKISRGYGKAREVDEEITYYKTHFWFFESKHMLKAIDYMSADQQELFFMDVRKVDIQKEAQNFFYGLQRYYLGQDLLQLELRFKQVVSFNQNDYGFDLKFALKKY